MKMKDLRWMLSYRTQHAKEFGRSRSNRCSPHMNAFFTHLTQHSMRRSLGGSISKCLRATHECFFPRLIEHAVEWGHLVRIGFVWRSCFPHLRGRTRIWGYRRFCCLEIFKGRSCFLCINR